MNHEQLAAILVEKAGGPGNITTVTHCATRLRFTLKDKDLADMDAITSEEGVLGCIYATGQLQIILGKDLLPVFDAVLKLDSMKSIGHGKTEVKKEKKTIGKMLDDGIGFVAGAVAPLVPALIGGGMLKVFLLLLSYVWPSFTGTNTYAILGWVANAPFYFMPIFVAYGAASKLGGTPIYAMAGAASLLTPAFTQMVADKTELTMYGLPVRLVKYPQQLLPALLISLAAYVIEKWLNKVIPGIFKSIFVGAGTMALSMSLGFLILGPLGSYVGSLISGVFVFLGNTAGPVAVSVLAACLPWLVMTGMHHAISPFMAQSIADPGYDPIFRPAFILHNMAEGGACLGVGLRTKDAAFRSEAFSLAFGCIVAGVTEPAIYGINFRLKKPMLGVMVGGAVGGVVAGLMGARAYAMGYSTVMALPIFENTILAMASGIVVAILTAALVTFLLGFEEAPQKNGGKDAASKDEAKTGEDEKNIVSVGNGNMIDISTVKDETFAQKILGDGVAFELTDGCIVAPCDGVVEMLAETGHAFGIRRDDDLSLLVHIGIDTVKNNGKGFTNLVKEGTHVKAGTPMVKVDLDALRQNYDMTTMLVVTEPTENAIVFKNFDSVQAGESILA